MKKILSVLMAIAIIVTTSTVAFAKSVAGVTTEVGFYISRWGVQYDEAGNIESRNVENFSEIVGSSELKEKLDKNFKIAIGENVTEEDIIAYVNEAPSDEEVFAKLAKEFENDGGVIYNSQKEIIGWDELTTDKYEIEWYVLKLEEHWHVDGRIHEKDGSDVVIIIPEDPEFPEEQEITDESIVLDGIDYAYIFGYEPIIKTDSEGKATAEIEMGMDDLVTVEQVSSMLMRMLDQHGDTTDAVYPITPAVQPHAGTWYERGLAYLCSVGGFENDEVIELKPITRGHVAKLVSCALNLNLSKETPFTDIADNQYKEYIEKVYYYDYMKGVGNNEFAPDAYMTRAEFCSLFNNIIDRDKYGLTAIGADGSEYEVTAETYYFIDMQPSHWAYEICLKATSAYDAEGYVDVELRLENIRNKLDHYDGQMKY